MPTIGMILCHSGISSNRTRCGPVIGPPEWTSYEGEVMYQLPIAAGSIPGDSGGPVWQLSTGHPVGQLVSGPEGPAGEKESSITTLLPLLEVPEGKAPGAFAAPDMGSMNLIGD
jgi:hypothetical protein